MHLCAKYVSSSPVSQLAGYLIILQSPVSRDTGKQTLRMRPVGRQTYFDCHT